MARRKTRLEKKDTNLLWGGKTAPCIADDRRGVSKQERHDKSKVCSQLKLNDLCRRGDLNPHSTKYRQILSLLRMPISPLRLRVQLLERNIFGMNQSTGPDSPSLPALNSHFLWHWVLFWVLTASNRFQFRVAAPL